MLNFVTTATDANKRAQSLDCKVKKWQGVPDDVLSVNASHKEKASALAQAATAFQLGKKGVVVDRMQTALSAFEQQKFQARPSKESPALQDMVGPA